MTDTVTTADESQRQSVKFSLGKQLFGVGLAFLLLFLAFRGTNFGQLWHYIQTIQPLYLLPLAACALISHFFRAWRWVILLQPLKKEKVSLFNSFTAVMIGYAVNIVLPRGGEVARLLSIVEAEELPWAGVLSTMLIDRLLDVVALVLLLGFMLSQSADLFFANMPWLKGAGISLCLMSLVGLALLPKASALINWCLSLKIVASRLPESLSASLKKLALDFGVGTSALTNPLAYPAIGILSFAIWFCYWLNMYLMVLAFGLTSQVSMAKSLTVFTIGSVGVLVPTPGSVGSYHFLVSQALMLVSNLNQTQALAFASFLHFYSFIIVVTIPAAICFVIQSARRKRK
jgi:uncharacterized protein (TIRG00374 family)